MLSKAGRVLYQSAKDVFPGVVVKKKEKYPFACVLEQVK